MGPNLDCNEIRYDPRTFPAEGRPQGFHHDNLDKCIQHRWLLNNENAPDPHRVRQGETPKWDIVYLYHFFPQERYLLINN
jgi:hypothetical protein